MDYRNGTAVSVRKSTSTVTPVYRPEPFARARPEPSAKIPIRHAPSLGSHADLADMVWPALMLERRSLSTLPIAAGLAVEWLVLWRAGFGLSRKKAAVVDLVMNTVSTGAGLVTIPLLGFLRAGMRWRFRGSVIVDGRP